MSKKLPIFYSALMLTGVNLLLRFVGTSFQVYLSASIGAAGIGLLPRRLIPRVKVVGNAALAGACQILLSQADLEHARSIAAKASHVELGGNPLFNTLYMEHMMFPERD